MSSNYYHYPVWVRLWHLVNAVLCIFLVVTGIIMFSYDPPADSAERYQKSVSIHNICGIIITISYLGFLTGNIFTENGKHYRISFRGLGSRLLKQLGYYLGGSSRTEQPPFPVTGERKFNPLQQVIYVKVMYLLVPLLFLTGIVLLVPGFILRLIPDFSGLAFTKIFHSVLALLIVIFMVIHISMSVSGRSPSGNLRSIITGWKGSD